MASELERAMSSFSQVDDRLTRNYDGVWGWGCLWPRALVELHGGSLNIQSRRNEGAVISILLPGPLVASDAEDAEPAGKPEAITA